MIDITSSLTNLNVKGTEENNKKKNIDVPFYNNTKCHESNF